MATAAQVRANRVNARKSTGPRTAAGKERASQNAVKHGLLAQEAVIAGEDPEEFEIYRQGMLEDLGPAGPVEAMLAERVVGLSWRLRRAERLQNAAFAALDDGTPTPLLDARLEEWKRLKGSQADRSVSGVVEDEFAWGRVVVEDFTRSRVLDRLLLYERRIESSLYRTMAELRKKQEARQASAAAVTAEEVPRSEGCLQAGQECVPPAELASFGANAVAGGQRREITLGGPEPPGGAVRDSGSPSASLSAQALPVTQPHGQDAHATEPPAGVARDPGRRSVGGNHGQSCPERSQPDAHAKETSDGVTTNPAAHHSSIPSFQHSSPVPEMPGEGQSRETKPKGGSLLSVACSQ